MFLHVSVIHSVHRGGLPQCMLGYHPPGTRQTPPDQADDPLPPGTRHTILPGPGRPPLDQADPPGTRQTPPRTRQTPPRTRQTPPRDQADPPGTRQTPPRTRQTPPREADSSIRSTSGRYASYWNAYL